MKQQTMTGLSDPQGRTFSYVRLSITDKCNFSCEYCLPNGYQKPQKKPSYLTIEQIQRIAQALAQLGVKKIRITGGEPVLRRDHVDIIRLLKSIDGIEQVAMTTNGYKMAEWLPQWKEAGLDSINVSIDSLRPEVFQKITGHNLLDSILAAMDQAMLLGFKNIKVNAVLMRQYNSADLMAFLQWIKHKPISLRFIQLMQTGDNQPFFQQQSASADSLLQQLQQQGWQKLNQDALAGPAIEYHHPQSQGKLGFILPYSEDFCASCNRLRISSTGKLHTCLFGEGGDDLTDLLQQDDQLPQLKQRLQTLLGYKADGHQLHDGNVGGTRHLAMLGG